MNPSFLGILFVNDKYYQVLRLLGKGKSGFSYLVTDVSRCYVLKQIHHEPCSYYQFGDKLAAELEAYKRLSRLHIPMPSLIDTDVSHERILKEYIPGETIYSLVLRGEMNPLYTQQMQEMCKRLYAADLNIDYFPTNFVVRREQLYYVDYECNHYMPEWSFERWGQKYWSLTPELEAYAAAHPEL